MRFRKIGLLALVVFLLAGCGSVSSGARESGADAAGNASAIQANLFSIDMLQAEGRQTVQMNFVEGSRYGSPLEAIEVPPYQVTTLAHPPRIAVTFEGLSYWEYPDLLEFQTGPYVCGLFSDVQPYKDEVTLYIQLRQPCKVDVKEHKGALSLQVTPSDEAQTQSGKWAVVADIFSLIREGESIPDYTPTLCQDGASIYMISPSFDAEAEAQTAAKALEQKLSQWEVEEKPKVILLDGQLPSALTPAAQEIKQQPLLITDTGALMGEMLADGGRFLCWSQDGRAVMAFPSSTTQQPKPEVIWQVEENGMRTRMMEIEYTSIAHAKMSRDGTLLGFIEQDGENRYMGLYDIKLREIMMLSEEGFGRLTAAFDFVDEGRVVGATGDNDVQLRLYDRWVSADEASARIYGMEERQCGYGPVQVVEDAIYYLSGENSILKMAVEAPERQVVTQGGSFALSEDGRYMAVTDYEPEEEDVQTALKVMDMQSGQSLSVSSGQLLMRYFWAADAHTLYYVLAGEGAYTYQLYKYNAQENARTLVGSLLTSDVYPGIKTDEILCVVNVPDRDYHPMTLRISLQ